MIKTTHMLTLPEGVYENIMDKVADALMESMSKEFEAMKQKSFAKKELREKLVKILSEGNQKQKKKILFSDNTSNFARIAKSKWRGTYNPCFRFI